MLQAFDFHYSHFITIYPPKKTLLIYFGPSNNESRFAVRIGDILKLHIRNKSISNVFSMYIFIFSTKRSKSIQNRQLC